MTNKIQISWKMPGGEIVVIGGEDAAEFRANAEAMSLTSTINGLLFDIGAGMYTEQRVAAPQSPRPTAAAENTQAPPRDADGVDKYIEVESIVLASGGEHPRWVVKGGSFTKYGITCWPEVLESAGLHAKLDPMKENFPSTSWRAYYVEKAGNDGKPTPDKVVRLEAVNA